MHLMRASPGVVMFGLVAISAKRLVSIRVSAFRQPTPHVGSAYRFPVFPSTPVHMMDNEERCVAFAATLAASTVGFEGRQSIPTVYIIDSISVLLDVVRISVLKALVIILGQGFARVLV